jgi:hypothetical protein
MSVAPASGGVVQAQLGVPLHAAGIGLHWGNIAGPPLNSRRQYSVAVSHRGPDDDEPHRNVGGTLVSLPGAASTGWVPTSGPLAASTARMPASVADGLESCVGPASSAGSGASDPQPAMASAQTKQTKARADVGKGRGMRRDSGKTGRWKGAACATLCLA